MDEELGAEYEEWLDEVELTLPQPIPEEEEHGKNQTVTADICTIS